MKSRHLRTLDLARAVGVHPNTVRLYEAWGFLPPVSRSPKGYRLYTEEHLDLMRLARLALHHPYPGGKQPVLDMLQRAKVGDLTGALEPARVYLAHVRAERARAVEAARVLERWAPGAGIAGDPDATTDAGTVGVGDGTVVVSLRVGEAARVLGVTADALRNWERNGLIRVPHHPESGYRLYSPAELDRLRVIRLLRCAGYSVMAILRALHHLDQGGGRELGRVLDTPSPGERDEESAVYITDRWLSTLAEQEQRALDVIALLTELIRKRSTGGTRASDKPSPVTS